MERADPAAVIEAFADGEPVAADQLANALSDGAGRDHLIDVLLLRSLVAGHATVRPIVRPAIPPSGVSWLRASAVLAAVLVAGLLTGFFAGRRTPAVPSTTHGYVTSAPARVDPVSAPAPTRVIRFEAGKDWNERAGGN